jgi:mono/diheme cytochrome c family protein
MIIALAACSDQPVDRPAADRAAAEERFEFCAACHGLRGRGDGPSGRALEPRPRDWSDGTWQRSVTDDHIRKAIVDGGPGVGLSSSMPGSPDLRDRPAVVDALVEKIRSFAK